MRGSIPKDLIPLFTPSTDELDLVALALSSHVHLYGRVGDDPIEIPAAELRRRMFWGGATRFESLQGETIIGLAVSKGELAQTLSTLSLDSL